MEADVANWIWAESRVKHPLDRDFTILEAENYLQRCSTALRPEVFRDLPGDVAKKALHSIQLTLGILIPRTELDPMIREALISSVPIFLSHYIPEREAHDQGPGFMFWDGVLGSRSIDPLVDRQLIEAIASALSSQLNDRNLAVQQSALHGLGHFDNEKRFRIIDEYLSSTDIPPDLREYAVLARAGVVA